jgi:2-dehydropantoate 2-reductase
MSKICVFGAGAVGSFVAAHLVRGGAQVSVIARGAHLAAVKSRGIDVRHDNGHTEILPVFEASDQPSDLGVQDVVIVTVKCTSLSDVAAQISPLLSTHTAVAFIGNGIPWWYADAATGSSPLSADETDPGFRLHDAVGLDRTIGGLAYCGCRLIAPGTVAVANYPSSIVLGELDGRITERVQAVADVLAAGGLPCRLSRDIRDDVWAKLLTNLSSGPICLLSRQSMRDSFADPVLHHAGVQLVDEGIRIAAAALGRPFLGSADEIIDRLGQADHKPSILQDLELGRPMELDSLLIRPQRFARRLGVKTPMLDLLLSLVLHAQPTSSPHGAARAPSLPINSSSPKGAVIREAA